MNRLIVITALSVFFSGAPSSSAERDCTSQSGALQLCVVFADPKKFDGAEIAIAALYRMQIHDSILTGEACPDRTLNLRKSPLWKADRQANAVLNKLTKKDRFAIVEVVMRGTFRVAKSGQCFGQDCFAYEFEESELLCASKPPMGGRAGDTLNRDH